MNLDLIDGIGTIANQFPQWIAFIVSVVIVVALIICIYRTKSIDFLLDRAWIFFGGSKDFNDKTLNDEWNVIRDLELYRYRYGFSFKSLDEVNQLRKRINENNINLIDLRRIGSVFDFNKFEVKSTTFIFGKIFLLISAIILSSSSYYGILNGLNNVSKFVVVDTDELFLFDGETVKINNKTLRRYQCSKIRSGYYPDLDSERQLFNEYLACEMFSPDGKKLYKESIRDKEFIGILSFILFTVLFAYIVRKNDNYNLAIKIGKQIQENRLKKDVLLLTYSSKN